MTNNIYFTSDSHYNHLNYCYGISEWDDKERSCRKFDTVEEMNELIIKNINETVKEDDTLYHLGDFSFNGIENIWNFRKQIKCKNIILVPGNHDHHIKKNKVLPNCYYSTNVTLMRTISTVHDGEIPPIFDGEFYNLTSMHCLAKTLFKEVLPQCSIIKIDKQEIVLSHFPLEEWENMDRGSIHLHGHCHHTKDYTDLNMYCKRMDVGMDWEEFRPFSWEEIKEKMKTRKILKRYD